MRFEAVRGDVVELSIGDTTPLRLNATIDPVLLSGIEFGTAAVITTIEPALPDQMRSPCSAIRTMAKDYARAIADTLASAASASSTIRAILRPTNYARIPSVKLVLAFKTLPACGFRQRG
ncbi:MAG: hypothetical protein KK482_27120 [Sinorhizobium meliloti]|nr:hypothetical protein [Sinorhizobium meliloti]